MFGNYQTVLGNGFAALASWGVVMPPGLGITDDIGVFVGQEVGAAAHCCPQGGRKWRWGMCGCACGVWGVGEVFHLCHIHDLKVEVFLC